MKRRRRGFSLVELVITLVIVGLVSAIAIPRMSSAGAKSKVGKLQADLRVLNGAVQFYQAERGGTEITWRPGGTVAGPMVARRLVETTDEDGAPGSGIFGPYLNAMPANPMNGLATIRVDGVPAGAGLAGWHIDSATQVVSADDSAESAAVKSTDVLSGGDGAARLKTVIDKLR